MVCYPPDIPKAEWSSQQTQNVLFNSALRQSTAIRKDLDAFVEASSPSPALLGQINASLTSFSRTIDDYNKLAKQEIVATKQEKAFERLKTFRAELADYREQFGRLRQVNDEMVWRSRTPLALWQLPVLWEQPCGRSSSSAKLSPQA